MAQPTLPIIGTLLGLPVHKPPATVRLLPLPLPPPPRFEVLGKTIQGLFFHIAPRKKSTVKPVARPPSYITVPPPPLPLPPLPSPKIPGSIWGSIQGLFVPPVRRQSPETEAQPSQREITDSIQRLIRHVTPAVCRPLALPLAAHVARDPTAAAALVLGSAAIAACQSFLEVVPYSNRVHVISCSAHEDRIHDEFEFAHFKKTNESRIFRPRHYQTVRARRLTTEIVGAINRGLAIKSRKGLARVLRPHTRHLDGLDWEAIVIKDKECNAGVFPGGGKIVILEGLLERFETDAEIAAIIAHEVGHVVQRCNSEWLSTPSLAQRQEAEADYIGIMLLAAAGFDPQVAPKVWGKFADMERNKDFGWRFGNFHSTHPPGKERSQLVSQCKVMEEALQLYREVTANQGQEKISPECGVLSLAYRH